jgi:hypothetical protein
MISSQRRDNRRHSSEYAGFMRRFLTMLIFATCAIPVAGCSVIRESGEPPGPLLCDPPEFASPPLPGLAAGPRDDSKISLTGSLAGAAPARWRGETV